MEFKVGDKLECIHSHEWCQFEKGKIYTVTNVKPEYNEINITDNFRDGWIMKTKGKSIFNNLLETHFKKVEEPNISLEELKKRFTNKEEKTTMENKFDKVFIEIGKEELIERLLGTPSKVELGVKFEDWARLNIDIHQIPNEMNYNEAIEFCRNKLIFRYLDNQEALNDEQEEKQAKEERKRQYKELKKEFGKGETK